MLGQGARCFVAAAAVAFASAGSTSSAQVDLFRDAPGNAGRPLLTRELVEVRGLSSLAISPDGDYAVIRIDRQDLSRDKTLLEWRVVRLQDGESKVVAGGGTPRWDVNAYLAVETPQWSPDSRWIYFRKVSGEEAQLWRVDRDGKGLQQLTHDASDLSAFIVEPDGKVRFATGPASRNEIKAAERDEEINGVLLDSGVVTGFPIVRGFPVNGRMATVRRSADAINYQRATLLGERPLRVMTLPAHGAPHDAENAVAQQFDNLWKASYGGAQSFDPGKPFRARSRVHERSATIGAPAAGYAGSAPASRSGDLLSWAAESAAKVDCTKPLCLDADHLAIVGWTADGRTLVFQSETFGVVRLNRWHVDADTLDTVVTTDGVLGSDRSGAAGECRLARDQAICIEAAADAAPKLVALELATGEVRTLLDPNPNLSADRLGVARIVTLRDRFGSQTIGRLVLPNVAGLQGKLPLVLTSYSCDGFLLGGSGQDVPEHVLAAAGFAVMCVDMSSGIVRRDPGFVFSGLGGQESGLDFFEDAIQVLDHEGIADPKRVMLTGFSGSATVTAFAITHSRKFTAAAVMTQGSLDAVACYLNTQLRSCADLAQREGQASPFDSRTGILRESPAWNAAEITAPLLMQLPEAEYWSMMQLFDAMTEYKRAVEMHIFARAYHHKNQPRQRLSVYNRNVEWANFWLRGVESHELSRLEQTTRWKALRDNQCKLFEGDNAMVDPPWYCGGS